MKHLHLLVFGRFSYISKFWSHVDFTLSDLPEVFKKKNQHKIKQKPKESTFSNQMRVYNHSGSTNSLMLVTMKIKNLH